MIVLLVIDKYLPLGFMDLAILVYQIILLSKSSNLIYSSLVDLLRMLLKSHIMVLVFPYLKFKYAKFVFLNFK
jgi:hypothetical protein